MMVTLSILRVGPGLPSFSTSLQPAPSFPSSLHTPAGRGAGCLLGARGGLQLRDKKGLDRSCPRVTQESAGFLFQDPCCSPGHQLCLTFCGRRKPARLSEYSLGFNGSAFTDGSPDALQNPCYIGTHGCDTNAACRPGPGTQFTCECSIGFRGDGRTCSGMAISCDL